MHCELGAENRFAMLLLRLVVDTLCLYSVHYASPNVHNVPRTCKRDGPKNTHKQKG